MYLRLALASALTLAAAFTVGCGSDSGSPETAEPVAAKWEYEGEAGPEHWGDIDDDYELCEDGHRQSPINLTKARRASFPKITTHYVPERLKVEDNGHAIEAVIEQPKSSISLGGIEYRLEQFHVHMPSEELVNGRRFPAVIHMVHISEQGEIAVLAILVRPGAANPAFDFEVPGEPGDVNEVEDTVDPDQLLPASPLAYRYQGSLTTPPCTEGVTWTVFRRPITLSLPQLAAIRGGHDGNNRPVQPRGDREILIGPALG